MKIDNYGKTSFSEKITSPKDSRASNTSSLLENLDAGDTFKAHILDAKPNQVTMRLSDGNVITARSMVTPDARIGEETSFRVRSNAEGQIMVEFVKDEMSKNVLDIINKSSIPPTLENMALIEQLLDKGIPIDSYMLQEVSNALLNIDGLDISKLIFFLDEEFSITQDNTNHLNLLLENKANITEDLNDLFLLIDNNENNIDKNTLTLLLSDINDSKYTADFIKELYNNIDIIKSEFLNNKVSARDILSKYISTDILEKLDDSKLTEILKYQLNSNSSDITKNVIKKALSIKELSDGELNKFYEDIYNKISDCKSLNVNEAISDTLDKIQKDIEFMNQINNYKEFIQIPIQLPNQQAQSDLYVLKNKKGQKVSKDNVNFLLSLDLANLGHIEAFIQKRYKDIDCQFKAENDNIIKLILSSSSKLMSLLAEKGYKLQFVSCNKLSEAFNVLKNFDSNDNSDELKKNARYTFDMRV